MYVELLRRMADVGNPHVYCFQGSDGSQRTVEEHPGQKAPTLSRHIVLALIGMAILYRGRFSWTNLEEEKPDAEAYRPGNGERPYSTVERDPRHRRDRLTNGLE